MQFLPQPTSSVGGSLHNNYDVGYLNGKADHEFSGAKWFAEFCEFGSQNPIVNDILHHGNTPQEYMNLHMCSEEDIPSELILLWWADMCVESAGEHAGEAVGFHGRLEGIEQRYGKDSKPYQICSDTIDWLVHYQDYTQSFTNLN